MQATLTHEPTFARPWASSAVEQGAPMTNPDDLYRAALRRTVVAKKMMDALQIEFERAEDEYHQACRALDELEHERT